MSRRHTLILIILAFFFGTACTFSTMLPTQVPPTEAPAPGAGVPEVQRPQTTFIDARTVVDSAPADAQSVSAAGGDNAAQSGSGAGAGSESYGSGGYGGGYGSGYGGYGGWGGYYGYYGWGCTPRTDWAYSYVIHYGDTLTNIAWRAGTNWQTLAWGNCIPYPDYIFAGQYIRVPNPVAYYPPSYPHYPSYPSYPHYPSYPSYPPPSYPTPVPPAPPPAAPVVVGSALTFAPYDEINNDTVILAPDTLITITWMGTFPTEATQVTFELIPPGDTAGTPIGIDSNLGDGASITWFAAAYTQGTIRAYASFTGGFAPQYSDSYYIIAGFPP